MEKKDFKVAVITVSDRCSRGESIDRSGPVLKALLEEDGYSDILTFLIPDEAEELEKLLIRLADEEKCSLILTSGGTGFAPRDVTPEATVKVLDRMAPGIAEAIRAESLKITPHAMLSRAVSGIRGRTLIINLPGSPNACKEAFELIKGALVHGLGLLSGEKMDK